MNKTTWFLSVFFVAIGTIALTSCNQSSGSKEVATVISKDSLIKRGSYLVNAIGCDDCHSPKRMGANGPEIIPELRFSGFPHDGNTPKADISEVQRGWAMFASDLTSAVGPWGQSFAANITSDETGIGNWSEAQFRKALREGKSKGLDGTRPILPPMPWAMYRNLSDVDIKAIYTFLQSTHPVNNVVPAPKSLEELSK